MRILPAHEGSSPPPRFVVVTGKRVDDENEENIAAEIEELIEACDNPDGKQCVEVLLDVAWRSTEVSICRIMTNKYLLKKHQDLWHE
jgi:hypothetical protein